MVQDEHKTSHEVKLTERSGFAEAIELANTYLDVCGKPGEHAEVDRVRGQFELALQMRDVIPEKTFHLLFAEVGIARIIYGPKTEGLHYTSIGKHTVIISEDYPDPSFAAELVKTHDWVIRTLTESSPEDYYTVIDTFLGRPPQEYSGHVAPIRKEIKDSLEHLSEILLTKDDFFRLCPGGEFLKEAYGERFWVQDAPLVNAMVYTDSACEGFKGNTPLLTDNSIHELGGHYVLSHILNIPVKTTSGEVIHFNGVKLLPNWINEGLANLASTRFLTNSPEWANFLDRFVRQWDGRVPTAGEIIEADSNLQYFFFTLFTCFSLNCLAMDRTGEKPNLADIDVHYKGVDDRSMTRAASVLVPAMNRSGVQLPQDIKDFDLGKVAIEFAFEHAQEFQRLVGVRVHAKNPGVKAKHEWSLTFEELCILFDMQKERYMSEMLERSHTTPMQKYLAGMKAVKTVASIAPDLKDEKSEIAQKERLIEELALGTEALKGLRGVDSLITQIETLCKFPEQFSATTFARMLSEVLVTKKVYLEEDFPNFGIRRVAEVLKSLAQVNAEYIATMSPKTLSRLADAGVDVSKLLLHSGPVVGDFFVEQRHPTQLVVNNRFNLATTIYRRHLETLILANAKNISGNVSILAQQQNEQQSILDLLSGASGLTQEDLMAVLTGVHFYFLDSDTYKAMFPAGLDTALRDSFWVRDHPILDQLVYVDRARPLNSYFMGMDNVKHEEVGHLVFSRTFKTAFQSGEFVFELNPVYVLPTWFTEGAVANVISSRYIRTLGLSGNPSFWEHSLGTQQSPVPLPDSETIITHGRSVPYLFHTLYGGGFTQYVGEALYGTGKAEGPSATMSHTTMVKGLLMLIKASRETAPLDLNVGQGDIGQRYLDAIIATMNVTNGISVNQQVYNTWYDENREHLWANWQRSFAGKK